jgi:hypothetical protein
VLCDVGAEREKDAMLMLMLMITTKMGYDDSLCVFVLVVVERSRYNDVDDNDEEDNDD